MALERSHDSGRGRDATDPGEIPVAGWKDVLLRVRRRVAQDNLSIIAAGVALYAVIATFPGLIALTGVYGVIFDPSDSREVSEQLDFLRAQLQPEATYLLVTLLRGLAESDRSRLGFGIAGGAAVTLWGASLALRALIRALNVAYGETEKRSFVERNGVALLLTLGAIAVASCIGLTLMSVPVLTHWFLLDPLVLRFVYYARWPVVGVTFWLSLLVFYRFGPSRTHARWSWVSWGAFFATGLWLSASGILGWYVAGSRSYHQAYGSIGVVVLVLAWFLVSSFCVLLGAEINAELERQTRRDTTVGSEKPFGARGAIAADTLGRSAHDAS